MGHKRFSVYNLKAILRLLVYDLWKRLVTIRSFLNRNAGDPFKLIWTDPDRIVNIGIGWHKYHKRNEVGRVKAGDWDLNTMPFEHLDVYQAFKERFVEGKGWEETSYYNVKYHSYVKKIADPKEIPQNGVMAQFEDYESLYREIRQNAFKSKQELSLPSLKQSDEITVRIGRNGELLFEDGRHRLAIAKILGLEKIPVLVTWRHKNWVKIRSEVKDILNNISIPNRFPLPPCHPDLNIPLGTSNNGHDPYFHLIDSHLPLRKGCLLHIGAEWGSLCHLFEDEGFECYGIEGNREDFRVLQALKMANNKKFTALCLSAGDFIEKSEFDVVLAFNVFHRYMKTKEEYERLMLFLSRLRTKILFYEPASSQKDKSEAAYIKPGQEEFLRIISNQTGLSDWQCIGYSVNQQPVFKFT